MKKLKKADKISNERHIGVLIEHFDSKIDLVVEQYGDVQKGIGVIRKTLDSHTEMIGCLAVDMEIVKSDLTVMKGDITVIKKDQGIMKADVEFIKYGLKKKVDVDEFAVLERRVTAPERERK